jgi:hypothetical protein
MLVRILLYACIIGDLSALAFGSVTLAFILAFALAGILLRCIRKYRLEPVVHLRGQSYAALRKTEQELESARKPIEAVEERKRELRSVEAELVATLSKEIQNVVADEKQQRDSADRVLKQATASALREKQRLDQQEAAEQKHLQATLGADVARLAQQLNQLQQAEATERIAALKTKQEQHVQNRLLSLLLTPGAIPGIGAYVVNNLAASGIRTAVDCMSLTYRKIPSVGPRRVNAILAWRQSCENSARRTMPTTLSHVEDGAISGKYAVSRTQGQTQLTSAQLSFATQQSSIKRTYAAARIPFDSQIATENAKHISELQRIQSDSKRRQEALQDAVVRAHQNANQAVAEAEKPLGALRKGLQTARWRVATARLESSRFQSITLRRYMRKVAIGR